jgi:hypothetical protein
MNPQVAAAFKVLREFADQSGYGEFISDATLQEVAAEIVASVQKATPQKSS